MEIERRLETLGITLTVPAAGPENYGKRYGKMRPFRISGDILFLGGHTAGMDGGNPLYPGRLGHDLTIEEGYAAARMTAINCISTLKRALGDLDRITGLMSSLNFVACTPDFVEHYKVTNGLSDLFEAVFGPELGTGVRASIGAASLSDDYCFETWSTFEIRR